MTFLDFRFIDSSVYLLVTRWKCDTEEGKVQGPKVSPSYDDEAWACNIPMFPHPCPALLISPWRQLLLRNSCLEWGTGHCSDTGWYIYIYVIYVYFVVLSWDCYCIIGSMLEAVLCSVGLLAIVKIQWLYKTNLSNNLVFNTDCFSVPYIAAVVILAAEFVGFCKTRQKEAAGSGPC